MTESDSRPQTRAKSTQPLKELPRHERAPKPKRRVRISPDPIAEPEEDPPSEVDPSETLEGSRKDKGRAEEIQSEEDYESKASSDVSSTQPERNLPDDINSLIEKVVRLEKRSRSSKTKAKSSGIGKGTTGQQRIHSDSHAPSLRGAIKEVYGTPIQVQRRKHYGIQIMDHLSRGRSRLLPHLLRKRRGKGL